MKNPSFCPHCKLALTSAERVLTLCPSCGGVINSYESARHTESTDVRPQGHSTSANWAAFMTLLSLTVAAYPIGLSLLKNNRSGKFILPLIVFSLILLTLVPLGRLMNRPLRHLPWYRRPERIVMIPSLFVVAAIYFLMKWQIVELNPLTMSVGLAAFSLSFYTLCVRRVR